MIILIKVLQVGCGKMSKYLMRYVYEKGSVIVGAVDIDPNIVGKDISFVMESNDKGVLIENVSNLEKVLNETNPDIAIVATMSLLNDLESVLKIITASGVNVITTCEEAFYPMNSNPNLVKEIDDLAKANNCTVTGSGYQDFAWGNLIAAMAGTTHKIIKIKGSSSYNVEDYGIALAQAHGAGLTLKEFEEQIASLDNISEEEREKLINNSEFLPSYMWNTVGWIADKLGLNIIDMNQKCVPMTSNNDLNSTTLEMSIPTGNATGMSAVVTANTKEGIVIEAECIGKVYEKDEFDVNEWSIIGEPDMTVVINKPATVELTCAAVVNRLKDVINAEAGFIPTSRMGEQKYIPNNID